MISASTVYLDDVSAALFRKCNMKSLYDKMNMEMLMRNINRLEWAADTTDDPKWRKEHLNQRKYVITLLLKRFENL